MTEPTLEDEIEKALESIPLNILPTKLKSWIAELALSQRQEARKEALEEAAKCVANLPENRLYKYGASVKGVKIIQAIRSLAEKG